MTDSVPVSAAPPHMRRNVMLLAACQALSQTGAVITITVSALTGHMLAENKALATMPFSFTFVMMMVATVPASLLMGRLGRRAGFTIGQCIGILGSAVATFAILDNDFVLFTIGSGLIGVHAAFWQYMRFAAADVASVDFKSRAISYVMAGGVVAAIVGPELAKASRPLFEPIMFAGTYAMIGVLSAVSIVLLNLLRVPSHAVRLAGMAGRRLTEIVRTPAFLVAVLSAMIGYGSMNLVMTATPLAMHAAHFGFADSAFVIEWHVLGMFVPGFFTGDLIRRFGVLRIIVLGCVLMMAAMVTNLAGQGFLNFLTGLVMLGMGWNFMFVGGTTLLTEVHAPSEKAKVQALNDFLVFATVGSASFSSGALQHSLGWQAVNLAIALPVLIAFGAVVALIVARRRTAAAG